MKHVYSIIFVLLCLVLFSKTQAQDFDRPNFDISEEQESQNRADTLSAQDESDSGGFFSLFTGKPGKAALYSLIFPGGGQFYNRDYWKIPIVWGAEGTAIYFIFENTKRYVDFRDGYAMMLNEEIDNFMGIDDAADVRIVRDYYRKNREVSWVVLIAFHLLNVFEAFIDRHLMSFDVNENLGFIQPDFGTPYFNLGSITIPLNKQKHKKLKLIQP